MIRNHGWLAFVLPALAGCSGGTSAASTDSGVTLADALVLLRADGTSVGRDAAEPTLRDAGRDGHAGRDAVSSNDSGGAGPEDVGPVGFGDSGPGDAGLVLTCAASPATTACVRDGGTGTCCGTCISSDFQSDSENCGECGLICPSGATCKNGQCSAACPEKACAAGQTCVGDYCISTTCAPENVNTPCVTNPGAPVIDIGVCCGTSCQDLRFDSTNCGYCGNACAGSTHCDNGQCTTPEGCSAGNSGADCALGDGGVGECCNGSCIDPTVTDDTTNCEGCGVSCPPGDTCSNNYCEGGHTDCPTGTVFDGDSACVVAVCPAGANGVEARGMECAFGPAQASYLPYECCEGGCVDPSRDPNNCGGCGMVCGSGICVGAACLPVPLPYTPPDCQPPNLPVDDEQTNCVTPACGDTEGALCAAGSVVGVCCGIQPTFACADLTSDANNCGACGVACPGAETCVQGVCSGAVAECGAGRNGAYCDTGGGTSCVSGKCE